MLLFSQKDFGHKYRDVLWCCSHDLNFVDDRKPNLKDITLQRLIGKLQFWLTPEAAGWKCLLVLCLRCFFTDVKKVSRFILSSLMPIDDLMKTFNEQSSSTLSLNISAGYTDWRTIVSAKLT